MSVGNSIGASPCPMQIATKIIEGAIVVLTSEGRETFGDAGPIPVCASEYVRLAVADFLESIPMDRSNSSSVPASASPTVGPFPDVAAKLKSDKGIVREVVVLPLQRLPPSLNVWLEGVGRYHTTHRFTVEKWIADLRKRASKSDYAPRLAIVKALPHWNFPDLVLAWSNSSHIFASIIYWNSRDLEGVKGARVMTGRLDLFQFAVRRFLENPNFVQLYRRRGVEKENPSIYSIIVNCAGMTPVQINEVGSVSGGHRVFGVLNTILVCESDVDVDAVVRSWRSGNDRYSNDIPIDIVTADGSALAQ